MTKLPTVNFVTVTKARKPGKSKARKSAAKRSKRIDSRKLLPTVSI